MKRWLILAAVIAALGAAVWFSAQRNERRAAEAEKAVVAAQQQAAQAEAREGAAKIDGAIKQAVAKSTERAVTRARSGERAAAEAIREIDRHAAASQPIDPALARSWVDGLKRLCDDAGPDACATTTATDRVER